ncbi:MAG: response regulator [Planctomycetota bacterium]|jgi:two-component system phosphate regulon response regulator PhoB
MSKWIPILVIDDDEITHKALEYNLKLYGFKVYLAKDGETGLKLAQEKTPELILLDWMMPGMDGLEVLSEVKHNKRTEHIPVFMLTGRGMIGDLDEPFEIGADDYIIKPFDLKQLGKILKDKWQQYTNQTTAR